MAAIAVPAADLGLSVQYMQQNWAQLVVFDSKNLLHFCILQC